MVDHTSSLARHTVHNIAWLGSSQAFRQVVALTTTVVLARYLSPSDYGVFAMTLFVAEAAQLFVDFGIGSALVQRKDVDQRLLSSCFWINVAIGLLAASAVVASGPLVAAYFQQPLLQQLLLVSALNLVIASVSVLPQAILARQLAYREVAVGTALGSLTGAVATMAMAVSGQGVWSLVFQPVIGSSVTLAYLLWRTGWRPSPVLDLASTRGVMRMSGHILAANLVAHVNRNLPHILLAPVLGAAATGTLSMAMTIAWLPMAQFTAVSVRASFPAFSRLQDEPERIRDAFLRAIAMTTLITPPVLCGLALLSGDVVLAVFGPKWIDAAPLVSLFCMVSVVNSVTALAGATILAQGRSDLGTKLSLITFAATGAALLATREQGLWIASVSLGAVNVATLLLGLGFAMRLMTASMSQVFAVLWRPAFACMTMASAIGLLVTWPWVMSWGPWPRIAAGVAVGSAAYLLLTWLVNRTALHDAWSLVGDSLLKRRKT